MTVSVLLEHAGGNRAEGGGLIRALSPQWKPDAGGQGSYEGWGWAAGREAKNSQRESLGAAESIAWQTAQHPGEAPATDSEAVLQTADRLVSWHACPFHACAI